MRFDVSELKSFKDCGRKWQLSSRNGFHLRPYAYSPNLFFGSLFHECLHALYASANLRGYENVRVDRIVAQAVKECAGDTVQQKVIKNMIEGYYANVLKDDMARFKVLDIEHSFSFPLAELGVEEEPDPETGEHKYKVNVCGSIDMIVCERNSHTIWALEHKTCKKFRTDIYNMMDEQPKTYSIALSDYVDRLNRTAAAAGEPEDYVLGGVIINEVKKVSTKFEYSRRECIYTPEQQDHYYNSLLRYGAQIYKHSRALEHEDYDLDAQPGALKCDMCDYASICMAYSEDKLDLGQILDEFQEEFMIRERDHLDEKTERKISDVDSGSDE